MRVLLIGFMGRFVPTGRESRYEEDICGEQQFAGPSLRTGAYALDFCPGQENQDGVAHYARHT
mgnify:CR=1 FL=1